MPKLCASKISGSSQFESDKYLCEGFCLQSNTGTTRRTRAKARL